MTDWTPGPNHPDYGTPDDPPEPVVCAAEGCTVTFARRSRGWKRSYCSRACRPSIELRVCERAYCDTTFRALKSGRQRFCSISCGVNRARPKSVPVERSCARDGCAERFRVVSPSDAKVYCSGYCRARAIYGERQRRTCPVCGREFVVLNTRQITCGAACGLVARAATVRRQSAGA